MEAMFAPIDEPLIDALSLDSPCRIAEIGCGGGGTTLAVLRRAPTGSVIHGYDVSPVLIEFARGLERSDRSAVNFELADVQSAAPPREGYHRLISRFGTMFFRDPLVAFTNLNQWLAPGGRFAFAVWGPQPENPWELTAREVVAEIVDVPNPGIDEPGPYRYADADSFLSLLRRAGFEELGVSVWRGKLSIGGGLSPHEAADFALAAFSSFSELIAQAGAGAHDRARRMLTERFSSAVADGIVQLDARVHIVTGTR
jgi:SAM-dependent methyltransferase